MFSHILNILYNIHRARESYLQGTVEKAAFKIVEASLKARGSFKIVAARDAFKIVGASLEARGAFKVVAASLEARGVQDRNG